MSRFSFEEKSVKMLIIDPPFRPIYTDVKPDLNDLKNLREAANFWGIWFSLRISRQQKCICSFFCLERSGRSQKVALIFSSFNEKDSFLFLE